MNVSNLLDPSRQDSTMIIPPSSDPGSSQQYQQYQHQNHNQLCFLLDQQDQGYNQNQSRIWKIYETYSSRDQDNCVQNRRSREHLEQQQAVNDIHLGYCPREQHSLDSDMKDIDNVLSSTGGSYSPETIHNHRHSVLISQQYQKPSLSEPRSPSSSLSYQQIIFKQAEQIPPLQTSSPPGGSTKDHSHLDTRYDLNKDHNPTRSLVAQASTQSHSAVLPWSNNVKDLNHKNGHGHGEGNVNAPVHSADLKSTSSSSAESHSVVSSTTFTSLNTTLTDKALSLLASNVQWDRPSELSPASAPLSSFSSSTFASVLYSNASHSTSSLPPSPLPSLSSSTSTTKNSTVSSSPPATSILCISSHISEEVIPKPVSTTSLSFDNNNFDSINQYREMVYSPSTVCDSYDQTVKTDTGSTCTTDTGQRRGLIRSMVNTEEDQEAPKAAIAGAAVQGEHSGIMGADAYHASGTMAGTVSGGAAFVGVADEGTISRYPFVNNVNNNHDNSRRSSSSKGQFCHYELHHISPPPPTSPSHQEYLQQGHSNSSHPFILSSETYHQKAVAKGASASSSLSSSLFSAGTSDSTAPIVRPSSPSMNNHPLSFDQTGQPYHIPFHNNNNNNNNTNSISGDTASHNNKRRSLADLLFVPTKTIKIKEKRNSTSSACSVESYRQDEAIEYHPGRPSHTKFESTTTTLSCTSAAASTQRMSLDPHSSPPAKKPTNIKTMSKVAGGSTSSPKTFQCTGYPGCNMVFTRSEHLARHERKHTGEKPYKCIVPSCPRTFSRFDNMMQHTQTHGDRPKRDSLVATTTGAARSRSSSMQTTSVINGRPRGGSSPGIFGLGYDDPHHRNLQSSPASHMNNPVFSQQQQHHHPYSPHHQQPQHHQHSTQWGFVGTSTPGSSALMTSQNNTDIHGGGSQPYLPNPMPIIRTLKANSRSLPHLQPRSSHSNSTDNFGTSLQHSFTGNETEELRRRKSEVLLPSFSYSGARAAAGYNSSHDVGLGMSSFPSKSEHSHTLPRVENLIPLEQDRLNEHRRTAHAMLHGVNASAGTRDKRVTPDYLDQNLIAVGHSTPQDGTNRSGSINSSLPQTHHLSTSEKDHLGHRKSPPESIYDGRVSKRSSNDPTDMVIQPLPSRDSRSGMQWFSQVNTPNNSSTELVPSMPHESQGPALASSQGKSGESSDSVNILPPILGHHDRYDEDTEKWDDRQSRPRSHSSHIHPLSRPSLSQFEPFGPSLWLPGNESAKDRIQFDPSLSPRLERHLEERFYPIRKAEVLDVIERMDAREFLGLKAQVAESFANDQFRNPEFLSNMTAVLCVIRAPHPAWKNPDTERKSSSGYHRSDELIYAHSHKDMDVDRPEDNKRDDSTGDGESMDVDGRRTPVFNQEHAADRKIPNVEQPCRYALDIDMDSFGCDPEPSLRALEGLTINSLFPTKSFVAGFEPVLNTQNQGESEDRNNTSEDDAHRSLRGYPSNARIGRFYLPERAFRTPESLAVQSDPKGSWICCQFEEYRGISIWVLESVLEKYHELARKHKMALTLVGAPVHHHVATYDHDEWEVHAGELYDVKVKESMLFPDMIQQVWKDIHRQYYQQHQNHHPQHLQPPPPPRQSFIQHQGNHPPTSSHTLPSHASNQIITYEEYQKSLLSGDPQRESYSHLYSQSHVESGTGPDNYSDHRQQQQTIHREDLSSVPSSPNSPRQDDFQEDNQTHESTTSTPQQRDLLLVAGANMHRRISIAELCNPMRSLATERERYSRNEDS